MNALATAAPEWIVEHAAPEWLNAGIAQRTGNSNEISSAERRASDPQALGF